MEDWLKAILVLVIVFGKIALVWLCLKGKAFLKKLLGGQKNVKREEEDIEMQTMESARDSPIQSNPSTSNTTPPLPPRRKPPLPPKRMPRKELPQGLEPVNQGVNQLINNWLDGIEMPPECQSEEELMSWIFDSEFANIEFL